MQVTPLQYQTISILIEILITWAICAWVFRPSAMRRMVTKAFDEARKPTKPPRT